MYHVMEMVKRDEGRIREITLYLLIGLEYHRQMKSTEDEHNYRDRIVLNQLSERLS